jgi:hypothetical protein
VSYKLGQDHSQAESIIDTKLKNYPDSAKLRLKQKILIERCNKPWSVTILNSMLTQNTGQALRSTPTTHIPCLIYLAKLKILTISARAS